MITEAILKLSNRENLAYEAAVAVMDEIMKGEATDAQKSAYLTAMHMKGETIEEITASASSMRSHCLKLEHNLEVLDIVGTGGDCSHSINISTISALIAAAAGVKVAKHGNRAASSKCGTADVLEMMGVRLDLEPEESLEVLKETNFAFLFAQKYHSAMRFVGSVRKEIRIPTIFNIMGPLSNPAGPKFQLLGVYEEKLVEPLARVLSNLGVRRGMVVYGRDGMDEISLCGPTVVCEIQDGTFTSYEITPEQFGMKRCLKKDLEGGSPEENAGYTRGILMGELKGPKADAVCLNAGAALHITKGVSMEEGIREAREMINSGKAMETLNRVIALTNSYD
ncbi:anthranilate phosphoribosyltransferase [Parasporobacterium paucivorans]|uniref:Anthranilate phosphoribosyltransferase n=1 Tax=Parasporobacterium paucivorans DSM 15970 TaxID=1122934 RepID=A0A1M6IG48_9FIRM|nr:anthranilate phosphoribosyltransferase [Parasporobacterium paucivorans]SHJ33411.1 anthranilate phosphoribosyltransferase [Parasporobacterium paucivorans DSM 15970]